MADHNLPAAYGKTHLVLLPVNPYLIHAYWEITPDQLKEAKDRAGEAQPVLRFYKVGSDVENPSESFDIEIDLQSPNWYVHLWSAEESYSADLALRRNDGTVITLARSQLVHMPRTRPVLSLDQRFMRVESSRRQAEIVSIPTGGHGLPEAEVPIVKRLANRSPIARAIDTAKIISEKLKSVYTSHQWRRQQPLKSEGVHGRSTAPRGRGAIDLTAMAEAKIVHETS